MAKVIARRSAAFRNPNVAFMTTATKTAESLYNAGYRKQREGEWKEVYRNNQATVYECTNCNHLSFGISDYCICGAKMKGGAE
jgi:hypothetical protein